MAYPRVFISSTCYDLGEIRDNLIGFLQGLYFDAVLSERGDVFYHPDLHTHEACVTEVENCHLFILIIGGRFGGEYTIDTTKSITNAEYAAAKALNRPVFTFIKRDLYDDHRLFQRNKSNKKIINDIEFPSIEKQKYASQIFEFINEVRLAEVNNGFFPFEYARDVRELLGKQISGMMCDFLNTRIKEKEKQRVSRVFDNLSLASIKAEELLESIYKIIDKTQAPKKIEALDSELNSSKFFQIIFREFEIKSFSNMSIEEIASIDPTQLSWIDFLVSTKDFKLVTDYVPGTSKNSSQKFDILMGINVGLGVAGDLSENVKKIVTELTSLFESYKKLTKEQRLKAISIAMSR